jgi:hypothetical protein
MHRRSSSRREAADVTGARGAKALRKIQATVKGNLIGQTAWRSVIIRLLTGAVL